MHKLFLPTLLFIMGALMLAGFHKATFYLDASMPAFSDSTYRQTGTTVDPGLKLLKTDSSSTLNKLIYIQAVSVR